MKTNNRTPKDDALMDTATTTTANINQQLRQQEKTLEYESFKILANLFRQKEITTAQLKSAIDSISLIISIRKNNAAKGVL